MNFCPEKRRANSILCAKGSLSTCITTTEVRERCGQYLLESRWVSLLPEISKQALNLKMGENAAFEKATAITRWIYTEFTYEPGMTDVKTHLEQAFSLRKGVCQDFTHVMIGMCRFIGLPARYASSYILSGGGESLVGSQASHAWCEIYLTDSGWIGFDPTNAVLADQRYIKLRWGAITEMSRRSLAPMWATRSAGWN